ncbi:MAG: ferrous iron transport protein A [Burkholderiales bacterium]|nr:ferrous iron transport protein A [Burkholderiales bacterium]
MALISLVELAKNEIGVVHKLDESRLLKKTGLVSGEVEARLLDMGIVEGVQLKVMHIGMWGHDPIAVRIDNSSSLIALRKNEAAAILLEKIK